MSARLCVIPARGGSKRFPRKNLARFDRRPLVARAVDVAAASRVFQRIVVSTEDAEIARVARRAGAEIHRRDPRLATDGARVVEVCRAVLDDLGTPAAYEAFCVLLPTSPLRTVIHVRESLRLLERRKADVVMSIVAYPHVPWWALRERKGYVRLAFGATVLKRRDRLPRLYRHNGVVLWARTEPFLRRREFYGARVVPYHMTPEVSVDVDGPLDLEFAEFLRRRRGA